jgi:hypothetical protein
MSEEASKKGIEDEPRVLREDISFLKERMADKDSIMTEDDYKALLEYRKEKVRLTSHENLRKQLGL